MDILPPRFWAKVDQHAVVMPGVDTPCWQWTAQKDRDGYGRFKHGGRPVATHRFVYEALVGPAPNTDAEGHRQTIDHVCRNRACVNPDHLELVAHRVNLERGEGSPPKTHCVRGHPLSGSNLRVLSRGDRVCRECDRLRHHRSRRPPQTHPPLDGVNRRATPSKGGGP